MFMTVILLGLYSKFVTTTKNYLFLVADRLGITNSWFEVTVMNSFSQFSYI